MKFTLDFCGKIVYNILVGKMFGGVLSAHN